MEPTDRAEHEGNAANIAEAIRAATRSHVRGALEGLITGYGPIDIAYAMGELTSEERTAVFELLDSEASGVVLEEVHDEITADLAEQTEEAELAEIIDAMPPDSGADAMNLLPEERKHRILNRIPDDEARELASLLDYHPDSAGGIMTTEVIASPPDITAAGVLEHIRNTDVRADMVARIYVVDEDRRLIGATEILDIINARDGQPLAKIMDRDPVAVHPETDQEEVVRLVDKYDLLSLPVVDEEGRFLGAIAVDDVIDALQEEATEDFAHLGGTTVQDVMTNSPWRSARERIPWLMLALGASLVSASVIKGFTATIEQAVLLTAFMPVISAISGASGVQSSTVAVRALALRMIQRGGYGRFLLKQLPTALLVAFVCAVAAAGTGSLLLGTWGYGIVVGIAMLIAVVLGTTLGCVLPLVFNRVGVDPAIASGPLVGTLNDAVSFLIYFEIAAALMPILHL